MGGLGSDRHCQPAWVPVGAENMRHVGRRTGTDGLKLIFLIVTGAVPLLGLSRREAWWKDAEKLMLGRYLSNALLRRGCW